ncbi:MAG: hypothetical protein LLF96_04180 [Eubacteriales bacterium]|nr:hypothetical protein [Eubacteriales bacterium]
MEWYGYVIIIVIVLAVLVLWKKGIITVSTVSRVSDAIEGIATLETSESLMSKLIQYANIAFHAAEQLAKTSEIAAEERKAKALELVNQYAVTDGIELTSAALQAADSIIEANCDINGHKSEGVVSEKETDAFTGTEQPVTGLDDE